MTTIDASTSVASEVAQFIGRTGSPPASPSAYGLPVEIASFSERLAAVEFGRLVLIVGAQGSGRRSCFTAWAAGAVLTVRHLRAEDVAADVLDSCIGDEVLLIESGDHGALPVQVLASLKARARSSRSVFVLANDYSFATACWEADPATVSLIDWDDIRVTATEAQQIACQHGSRTTAVTAIESWRTEVENWLFGICLVARSKLHHQPGSFPRAIQSYMRRNIFCKLPAEMKTLLKVAAVSMHAELNCSGDTAQRTAQLVDAHLADCMGFVRRESAACFHLHPLFRRYLLSELAEDVASAETLDILRGGTDAHAVLQLLVKAGRHEEAAAVLARELSLAPRGSRLPRAQVLLDGVDAGDTRAHPLLCFWKAELVRAESNTASRSLFMVAAESYLARGQLDLAISSWARACSQIGMGYQAGKDLDESTQWMEHVDQSVADSQWYLRFPGVVSTMTIILSMRQPRAAITRKWVRRASDSLALNGGSVVGPVALRGVGVALLKELDLVRLEALANWANGAPESLLGPEASHVRSMIDGCCMLLRGDIQAASIALHSPYVTTQEPVGIPLAEAFLTLGGAWLGVETTKKANELAEPFRRWSSCTSDFYCLRLIAGADESLREGDLQRAQQALATAESLCAHIESPFIAEFTLLCSAQLACIAGQWAAANDTLTDFARSRQSAGSSELLDLQYDVLRCWVDFQSNHTTGGPGTTALAGIARFLAMNARPLLLHTKLRDAILSEVYPAVAPGTAPAAAGPADYVQQEPVRSATYISSASPELRGVGHDTAKLRVKTFGAFQIHSVCVNGESRSVLLQAKIESLFRMLIIAGASQPLHMHEVVDLLWPDSDGDAAKRNFDSAVHRLRKALGNASAVVLRRGQLSLNPDVIEIDRDELAALCIGGMDKSVADVQRTAWRIMDLLEGPSKLLDHATEMLESTLRKRDNQLRHAICRFAGVLQQGGVSGGTELFEKLVLGLGADPHVMQLWLTSLVDTDKGIEARLIFERMIPELEDVCTHREIQHLASLVRGSAVTPA